MADNARDDDADDLLAEAKRLDAMFRERATPAILDRGSDPTIVANLCRALEQEAQRRLQSLDREHLLALHKSLSAMRQQVEQALKDD